MHVVSRYFLFYISWHLADLVSNKLSATNDWKKKICYYCLIFFFYLFLYFQIHVYVVVSTIFWCGRSCALYFVTVWVLMFREIYFQPLVGLLWGLMTDFKAANGVWSLKLNFLFRAYDKWWKHLSSFVFVKEKKMVPFFSVK